MPFYFVLLSVISASRVPVYGVCFSAPGCPFRYLYFIMHDASNTSSVKLLVFPCLCAATVLPKMRVERLSHAWCCNLKSFPSLSGARWACSAGSWLSGPTVSPQVREGLGGFDLSCARHIFFLLPLGLRLAQYMSVHGYRSS